MVEDSVAIRIEFSLFFHLRSDPAPSGTSILAIKYDGGIMMAADTLGSYGSLARFRDERKYKKHKIEKVCFFSDFFFYKSSSYERAGAEHSCVIACLFCTTPSVVQ